MIRPGKSVDAFALTDIIVERHPDTRYAGEVGIVEQDARRLFAQAAQRHGQTNEGGMFLMVNEVDGNVDAFILGTLTRIYIIGDKLGATDLFLLGRKSASPRVLLRLFDAYVEWAEANPKVYEIGASWADTIPGNDGIRAAFKRRGFSLCSETYRRERSAPEPQLRILKECVA